MPYWTYILQSQSSGRYYCGHTDNLDRRLSQHNNPDYKSSRTTKVFKGPWEIVWTAESDSRGNAMILEKKIKRRGIKRYLLDVLSVESRRRRD